jgi:hypothetical protein
VRSLVEPLEHRLLLSAAPVTAQLVEASTTRMLYASGQEVASTSSATVSSSNNVASSATQVTPAAGSGHLTINLTFAASVTSLPNAAQVESACNFAAQQLGNIYTDPSTVNITVAGMSSGLGMSSTFLLPGFNYTQVRNALISDATTANDQTMINNDLPATDPTSGAAFWVPTAQAKALGLASPTGTDGTFSFNSTLSYTFDPNNRAVPGKFDFIGVALHEMTEIMGRINSLGGNVGGAPAFFPFDFVRFVAPGIQSINQTDTNVYFSIDDGTTNLKGYNPPGGGDLGDWASGTNDACNAFSGTGVENDFSAVDQVQMDVIGYDLAKDTITGTGANDQITLTQDSDHVNIDWTMGVNNNKFPIADANGLTINGNGGNDTVTLVYTNGNPLPHLLQLNSGTGNFTINGLQGTAPLAGTTMDIARSTVFIGYSGASPLSLIQTSIKNGYNGGAWNGTNAAGVITSSAAAANHTGGANTTGIGYADSADGQGVNSVANTVELTYTLYGDANLDHLVNSADLQRLLATFNNSGAWDQGDFNYDGIINSADLQALLATFNTALGSQAAPAGTTTAPTSSASASDQKPGAHTSPVPVVVSKPSSNSTVASPTAGQRRPRNHH